MSLFSERQLLEEWKWINSLFFLNQESELPQEISDIIRENRDYAYTEALESVLSILMDLLEQRDRSIRQALEKDDRHTAFRLWPFFSEELGFFNKLAVMKPTTTVFDVERTRQALFEKDLHTLLMTTAEEDASEPVSMDRTLDIPQIESLIESLKQKLAAVPVGNTEQQAFLQKQITLAQKIRTDKIGLALAEFHNSLMEQTPQSIQDILTALQPFMRANHESETMLSRLVEFTVPEKQFLIAQQALNEKKSDDLLFSPFRHIPFPDFLLTPDTHEKFGSREEVIHGMIQLREAVSKTPGLTSWNQEELQKDLEFLRSICE